MAMAIQFPSFRQRRRLRSSIALIAIALSFALVSFASVAVSLASSETVRCFVGGVRRTSEALPRSSCLLHVREVASDASVPEEHRGLHSALYGEGAGDAEAAHSASEDVAAVGADWPGRLDGSEVLDAKSWLDAVRAAAQPESAGNLAIGLFALYENDAEGAKPLQVGYSRRVPDDLARGIAAKDLKTPFARVRLFGSELRMWTRARLEEARQEWLQELGDDVDLSNPETLDTSVAPAMNALSEAEVQAFEERKWKMQMAMGTNLADSPDDSSEDVSAAERRLRFLRAVEGDDWSAVIDEQTRAAVGEAPEEEEEFDTVVTPVVSPFAQQGAAATAKIPRELTAENVRLVLEPLRPMLKADGGDIEVLGVSQERGAVMLGLMGACTTCPASGDTMENGIEKALYDHFGRDVVQEIVRVDSGAADSSEDHIRQSVEAHLETMSETLEQEGASAWLAESEDDGSVEVKFAGSALLMGLVKSSLSYRFPELAGRLRVRQSSPHVGEATALPSVAVASA